jgi:membrane-associated phospholipid phosphatase
MLSFVFDEKSRPLRWRFRVKMSNNCFEQAACNGEAATDADGIGFRAAARLFRRHQPVTISMVALGLIVPLYLFIPSQFLRGRAVYVPAVWLDDALPVEPAWSVVYLSLFLAVLLPGFLVHQQELLRRTVNAFLAMWLVAYVFFVAYPTIGPRASGRVIGDDFSAWMLQSIYSSDHRYNCFPSLHVAQCFLAAMVCNRIHRGVGAVALLWAALVGVSTLYTKQHYVLDAISGALLGYIAYFAFLRGYPRKATPELERRLAPHLALGAVATYAVMVGIMWIAYLNGIVV